MTKERIGHAIRGLPQGDGGTAGFSLEGITYRTDGGTVCNTDCQGECHGSCVCGKRG